MELFSSYIPIDRRQAIFDGEMIPDRLDGTVLFADICGFTPLTAILQKTHGSKLGPEELTKYLNQIYETIILEVNRYGGSVINFSGDGILCWFGDTPSKEIAALQATACGLAMQASIKYFDDIDLSGRIINFQLKVAIATGSVRRFRVGDPQIQYLDILAGQTVDRTAAAEKLAQAGEVIVSSEVVACLGDCITICEWRSDPTVPTTERQRFAVINDLSIPSLVQTIRISTDGCGGEEPLQELIEGQIRPWLLLPVYERLKRGHTQFLAEIRQAVALFLKFTGIDYDQDEAAYEKIDAYIRLVQNVLTVYGGHLIQVTIGDKGSYLYASFGAPLAHDDDPERAVTAALLLRSLSKKLGFISHVKIGISWGTVYGGAYGGTTRQTYGVLGDEVNVAARLMGRAQPGQIITTTRIVKAVSTHSFEFQFLGQALLKGRTELLPIFAVLGKREQTSYLNLDNVTVERSMERSLIVERLQALVEGQQSQMIVIGEAGAGKTNLLISLLTQAQHLKIPTLIGKADPVEQTTPYHAWRSIFRRIFDIDEQLSSAQLRQRVLTRLTRLSLLERAPLLNAVLPLNLPDNELTARMTGQVRADNTREFLVQILMTSESVQSGMVLALDNAQWLDSASWALTLAINQTSRPFLLFLALRPFNNAIPDDYNQLVNSPNTYHFMLDRLSKAGTGELMRDCLKTAHVSAKIIEIIHQKAEGHPFFSRELAFALWDKGLIHVDRHTCQPAPQINKLEDIAIPDTVEEIVISRLDQLTAAQQLTLKVASIIGPVFSYSTLYEIYPVKKDRPHLLHHLEAAERLNLIRPDVTKREPTYLFNHSIIRQSVYDLLLSSQKQCLHDTIARWYEQHQADKIDQYRPVLVHHWREAGRVQKTLEHLEKAGDYALQSGAFQEAMAFFEEILELGQRIDNKMLEQYAPDMTAHLLQARWRGKLGRAYYGLGQLEEGRINFERAIAIFDQPIPVGIGAFMVKTLSALTRQLFHRLWPRHVIGRVSSSYRQQSLHAPSIYRHLSSIYYLNNQLMLSAYAALGQINMAERLGSSNDLVEAYAVMGLMVGCFKLHGLAETYLQRGLKTAQTLQPSHAPVVLYNSSLYRAGSGQFVKSRDEITQALEIYKQIGDKNAWRDCMAILGTINYYLSDFEAVRRILTKLLDDIKEDEGQICVQQIWAWVWLGGTALRSGQLSQAVDFLEKARIILEKKPEEIVEISCLGLLAQAYCRQGRTRLAKETADKAAALISKTVVPSSHIALDGYIGVADVYLAFWQAEKERTGKEEKLLAEAAWQACRAIHQYKRFFPMGQPAAWLYEGIYHRLSKNDNKALNVWYKGLGAAERLAMTYEQGRLHYEIGRCLPAEHSAYHEHLTLAQQIFGQLNATYDLAQMQGLRRCPPFTKIAIREVLQI